MASIYNLKRGLEAPLRQLTRFLAAAKVTATR